MKTIVDLLAFCVINEFNFQDCNIPFLSVIIIVWAGIDSTRKLCTHIIICIRLGRIA